MEYADGRSMDELIERRRNIILEGADAATAQGFTQVPNFLLKSKKLSAGDKMAFAMLLSYAWQNDFCFPGQALNKGCILSMQPRLIKPEMQPPKSAANPRDETAEVALDHCMSFAEPAAKWCGWYNGAMIRRADQEELTYEPLVAPFSRSIRP